MSLKQIGAKATSQASARHLAKVAVDHFLIAF
jgi:hypothetical protein